jgi:hypothetical protein
VKYDANSVALRSITAYSPAQVAMEDTVANKEQKRSSKEAKKPKQNKKGADKGAKRQTAKS